MISSAIATALKKYEVNIMTNKPEVVVDGVEKIEIYRNNKKYNVIVIMKEIENVEKIIPDNSIIVNLTDTTINGNVIPLQKLNILLSRVGLNTETLKTLKRYRTLSILPNKTPFTFVKEAITNHSYIYSYFLPLMYPYLVYRVSHRVIKKGFFSKKVLNLTGNVIVDLLSFSYCDYTKRGLSCDKHIRFIPENDEEISVIKELKDAENSMVTTEGFSKKKKIPTKKAEEIIEIGESLGFVIRYGKKAFQITKITPPIIVDNSILKIAKDIPIPLEWAYFPFMCIKSLAGDIEKITKTLNLILDSVSSEPIILLYPYIVLGSIYEGKTKISVYDAFNNDYDERVADVISKKKIGDCIYLLSKS